MIEIYLITLAAVIPWIIGHRLRKSGRSALFNACLYPLVFSYFYLLVPSFLPAETPISVFLRLDENSWNFVNEMGAWFTTVFLAAYVATQEQNIVFAAPRIPASSRLLSACTLFITSFIALLVLVQHGGTLYSLSSDRFAAYEYYRANIIDGYKFQIVFLFCVTAAFVQSVGRRKTYPYLATLPFIAVDVLQGGRGLVFVAIFAFALTDILVHPERRKTIAFFGALAVCGLFVGTFLRRTAGAGGTQWLVDLGGEFYFTRLTAEYVYLHYLSAGSLLDYATFTLSRLVPQPVLMVLNGASSFQRYDVFLNSELDVGFGLAGSIMAESAFYGGLLFCVLSPIIIAAIYFLVHKARIIRTINGLLFFILLVSSSYQIFRSGFFSTFTSLLYIFFVYFAVFTIPLISKKALKGSGQS